MRAKDLTKGNIAYHDELNPAVWDGRELQIDVRYKLLEIAKRFIEYLEVPNFKLVDVILRGSLVNYNYTAYSDFDLHIVTDFSTLDCDITEAFYLAKKRIWNDEHDIIIRGHEVELYVEDKDAKNVSEGTYSVLDNRWLRVPKYQQPDIDDRAVNAKARDLMTQITRAIRTGSVEDITRLQDKIKAMRQSGLDRAGEFSTENLAFKIIRNKGYLNRLYKNKNTKFDQELSLDEGIKQNAAVAALVAALSGNPAQADYNYPETQKKDPNAVAKALIILRSINKMKNYGQAGLEAEAQQELNNILRSMQGMPNQSRVYPIIKDLINSPETETLPPLQEPEPPVNERKKAKKKKKSAKRRSLGGYYGYYWGGGYHDHADSGAGDAGGGGDSGGGESMYESEARLDPRVEEFLDGLTPDDVGRDEVGDYIVHYEGFTDQCQDSEEYQANPEAVFQDVWGDFKRRMGDKDPINYGIVGSEEYPIVYSVFRK